MLLMTNQEKNQERVAKANAIRFSVSLLLAFLSIALLSMIGCSRDDSAAFSPSGTPCNTDESPFSYVACDSYQQPVCGCDGVTYKNACEAIYYNGISKFTSGPCKRVSDCFTEPDSSLIAEDSIYNPVCGCNGETYSNAGEALLNGISSYTKGICGTVQLLVCAGLPQTIGVHEIEGRRYEWSNPLAVGCPTCAVTEVLVTDTAEFILSEYETEKTGKPVKIYPFKLIPVDCLR
jgi:hypothetical protein